MPDQKDQETGEDRLKPEKTPDKAEGERETVEESIKKHEEKKDQNS